MPGATLLTESKSLGSCHLGATVAPNSETAQEGEEDEGGDMATQAQAMRIKALAEAR